MLKKISKLSLVAWVVIIAAFTLFSTAGIGAAADGILQVFVEKDSQNPIVSINVYLFNESGTYLSQSQITDSGGKVEFNLTEGTYKVRADYLGYQFWSPVYTVDGNVSETLTIAHQDVTITVEGNYPATEPISNIPVYLFTEAGSYMSQSQTTDANGQVVFNLPEQSYKVRADYMSQQFWSDPITWQNTTVTVPMADSEITVLDAGLTLEGIPVYVFTASGTYLNINDTTAADGKVNFHLAAGDYKFRADYQSSQYWSEEETLIAGQVNPVTISTGGGVLTFTVLKEASDPLVGVNCYAFTEGGTYLSMSAATDANGQVTFHFSDGSYKIRVDYLGYQFWSPVYAVTGDLSETLTIAHQDVTITVEGNYPATEPIPNIPVYLFTEAGSYMSQSQTTDANGQVVFNLPEQSYKVRADYMSQQFWSDPFTWQNTTVTVPMADSEITVLDAGLTLEGVPVYVFTASGTYLNINDNTDANGKVTFHLAAGDYKFRADYQSSHYWSEEETLTAGQVNPVTISTGGGVLTFTVLKEASDPLVGVNCYAFTEGGSYLSMTAATDANGQVTFHFSDGIYKIRVDYLGYQFWSQVYAVTGNLSETLTIAHQDVTITVQGNYPTTEPIPNIPVYLFTEAGSYMSQNQITDANGQVVFNLPEQAYKVRADYMSQQFWSDPFIWQDATITISRGLAEVHVTRFGSDVSGASVYLFSQSGSYLGWSETTDANGKVQFVLPDRVYKFRADEGGNQAWSTEVQITAGVVNPVEIDLSPITVSISADPENIQQGESSTLSWTSTGADSCVIEPDIGAVDLNGSVQVSPSSTTAYTITASGLGGTVTDSVTVEVATSGPAEFKITPDDPVEWASFGTSVAIDGDYAIIGAYGAMDNGIKTGAAYIYKREGSTWIQQTKLVADDGTEYARFGTSVAIDGDYAIIGARRAMNDGDETGAVYVFKREGAVWNQQAKLVASDSEAMLIADFGISVAIDGDCVIIGAESVVTEEIQSGAAYFFKREGSIWSQQAKLVASDASDESEFGHSVDIDGDYLVVGAEYASHNGLYAGAAYIFKHDESTWSQQAKLVASDATEWAEFGLSVAIGGDYAVIGSGFAENNGIWTGAAYVFKREGSIWFQQTKLVASDAEEYAYFGASVDIEGDYVAVGAEYASQNGLYTGAAYIFKREGTGWGEKYHLVAGDASEMSFGCSVSFNGGNAVVGASRAVNGGIASGSAYFYTFPYVAIESAPEIILSGESSSLDWSSTNISSCVIEPGIGSVDPSGSLSVSPSESTTYTITGSGPLGTTTDTVTVYVIDPTASPTVEFHTDSDTILPGESCILSWTSTNADTVIIDQDIGSVSLNGALSLSPSQSTTYTITASGPGGDATASVTVNVPDPPSITILEPDIGDEIADACFCIHWTDEDLDDDAVISLYYDTDSFGGDGTLIVSGLSEDLDDESGDSYVWDTTGIPEGSYYVYAVIDDGEHDPMVDYSDNAVTVNHAPPPYMDIKLPAQDAVSDDEYGSSVSVSGDYAIVGANSYDTNGSVYIYKRDCLNWNQQTKIAFDDAATGQTDAPRIFIVAGDINDSEVVFTDIWDDYESGEAAPLNFSSFSYFFNITYLNIEHSLCSNILIKAIEFYNDGEWLLRSSDAYWTPEENMTYQPGKGWLLENREGYLSVSGAWAQGFKPEMMRITFEVVGEDSPPWQVCSNDNSEFGYAVSTSGDYAVVGDPSSVSGGVIERGSAYIFKRDGSTWTNQANLFDNDAEEGDRFGSSVSVSGDYAIVGSPNAYNGSIGNAGSAFIFKRDGSTWTQHAKLTADDAGAGDHFGTSVSVSGEYAVVGIPNKDDSVGGLWSSGAAYIFKHDGSTWTQQAKLTADDAANGDNFGFSVSINGDYVVVGAVGDDDGGSYSGSAYIFKRDGSTWTQQAKLTADYADAYDNFGTSVSISGDFAVVGADNDDDFGSNSGAVYLFKREGSAWILQSKLTSDDADSYDYFGSSVSISGDAAIVGAPYDDNDKGSAHIMTFPAVTVSLNADPDVTPSGESTLTWSSKNADSCVIEPGIGSVPVNGSTSVTVSETTTYTITASGPLGTATASATVTYGYPSPQVEISANPYYINAGESSTLIWSSSNANTVTIDPGIGNVVLSGSESVSPSVTTIYNITATGPGGTASASVTVSVYTPPQPFVGISAEPETIDIGESTTLTWNSVDADTVTFDPDIGSDDIDGSTSVSLVNTTTFTITATGPGGTATASVTVTVTPITLSITSPWDGETINRPNTMVQGTVVNTAGNETGVVVNGVAAMVYGDQFVANNIPLQEGENTITAVATDAAGYTASASITVYSEITDDYIRVTAEPESGVSPLEVVLRAEGSFTPTNVEFTKILGPEPAEWLPGSEPNEITVRLEEIGVYYFLATAEDDQNNTYTDTVVVQVLDQAELDAFLRGKWDGMRQALIAGDIEGALSYHYEGFRDKYEAIYNLLGSDLPTKVNQMQDIEPIYATGDRAKYRIRRDQEINGQAVTISYYIYFSRDENGLWQIERY